MNKQKTAMHKKKKYRYEIKSTIVHNSNKNKETKKIMKQKIKEMLPYIKILSVFVFSDGSE